MFQLSHSTGTWVQLSLGFSVVNGFSTTISLTFRDLDPDFKRTDDESRLDTLKSSTV